MSTPDNTEWLSQVRRRIDAAKVAVTSNARLSETELAAIASELESTFKKCRALVEAVDA